MRAFCNIYAARWLEGVWYNLFSNEVRFRAKLRLRVQPYHLVPAFSSRSYHGDDSANAQKRIEGG